MGHVNNVNRGEDIGRMGGVYTGVGQRVIGVGRGFS